MAPLSPLERDRQDALRELREADESLPACFERVAAAHPHRLALVSDRWQATYVELNAAANRLAHVIIARGGAPGDRVAILMAHDTPAIAAVVAVLKAGGIVVALNPTHPPARLRELIEDSEPAVILTDASHQDLAADIAGDRCALVRFEQASAQGSVHNPSIVVRPSQTAVLGYTSGSTGRPKAVMMTHRQFRRNVIIHTEAMDYCAADRIPLFGSLSGGQGITGMWCALLNGAALYPFPVIVKGVTGLASWMTRCGITVYASSASIYRNFMKTLDPDFRFFSVRTVRLSSEPATSDDFKLFQAHFPDGCWFVHTLSCSETCNIAWSRRAWGDKLPEGRLPIGAVSKGQEVLILDENDRPVEVGKVGEIAVRSRYVAAGYWRNPNLTAARFSADLDGAGTRLVRTGDLGRIDAAGALEFCGRRDDQIKIRGNRVELSEIEEALHRLAGIERAVVEAVPRAGREATLVSFMIVRGDHPWSRTELRRALRAVLPEYMVPAMFLTLDQFPLTPTGKIDREKLRLREIPMRQQLPDQQPKTDTEASLADVWAEVFDLDDIGRHDNFFDLGGDSLTAMVVAARIHGATGVELNLGMFSAHPTVSALATLVDQLRCHKGFEEEPLVPVSRARPLPLSFAQERVWLASQTDKGQNSHTHANRYRIIGPLDRDVLRECMSFLVRQHEILRTTYTTVDGSPTQVVHDPGPVRLPYFDISGSVDVEHEAERIFQEEAGRPLDLARLPLVHYSLIRVRENEHWLQRVLHHITSDAWSSQMFYRELAQLYAARRRGDVPPLSESQHLQYADYAVWERRVMRAGAPGFQEDIAWWKRTLAESAPMLRLPCRRSAPLRTLWHRLGFDRNKGADPFTPADGLIRWGLDVDVSRRLRQLGRAEDATYFLLRLAAFVALLASETNQRDILIGTYVTNRNRSALQTIYGLFVNLVALRFRYQPEISFREWLVIVRQDMLAAEARSALPFEKLCEELDRNGVQRPAIQVIFQVSQNVRQMEFADLRMIWMEQQFESMPWGFSMNPDEHAEQHNCRVAFDANIYDPVGVRAFVERYKQLLDAVSRQPDRSLAELLAMSRSGGVAAQ